MKWTPIIIAAILAVFAGAGANVLLTRRRPAWRPWRRLFTAAAAPPALVAILTVAGVAYVLISGPGEGENMQDLAVIVTLIIGVFFAFVTFCGGLVGAVWVDKGPRQ